MLLLAFLASVVVWDLINKGPADAAVTRASARFYEWATEEVDWRSLLDRAGEVVAAASSSIREATAEAPAVAAVATPPAVEPILTEALASIVDPTVGGPAPRPEPAIVTAAATPAAVSTDELPLVEAAAPRELIIGDSVFARPAILAFIAEASARTDVSAAYLEQLALRESSFNPVAASDHSSARGLYQFIEGTWLDVFARHGAEHDQAELASLVTYSADGRPTVDDAAMRQRILDLRFDPKLATFLAAQHAGENRAALEAALGRPVSDAELYVAHFLGLSGARTLIQVMAETPDASAADLFPWAAQANRRYFYDHRGREKSIANLYAALVAQAGAGAGAHADS